MSLYIDQVVAFAKEQMLAQGGQHPLVIVTTELPQPYLVPITSG
jgi:hypothetical protein